MNIYVNQSGYLPSSVKTAIVSIPGDTVSEAPVLSSVACICTENDACILEKAPVFFGLDAASGDFVWQLDFSELTTPGTYRIRYDDSVSHPFTVGNDIYGDLNVLLIRALYYQRCGTELLLTHAGKFARQACHTAPSVLWTEYKKFLNGTVTQDELQCFHICGGWHDAGDYGRYTTAAACALGHLLYAYRFFPDAFTRELNLPETGNGIPDILNECRYELDWMIQMQADDGSVYHKQTTQHHAGFVMPCEDTNQMLLFPASSMAVADFAGTMALASRIYHPFDADFSRRALAAAKKSYRWLSDHPEFLFEYDRDSSTGGYGDRFDFDERMWAAMELYRTTGEVFYLNDARMYFEKQEKPVQFGWGDVSGFAAWALLEEELMPKNNVKEGAVYTAEEAEFRSLYKDLLLKEATHLLSVIKAEGYRVAMKSTEYVWGSNLTVLNRGMLLGTAYLLDPKHSYYTGVVHQMDYLLGINATDYSYVTGVGAHAFCNPHNRVPASDGIEETIPGFVSGGANGSKWIDPVAKELIPEDTPPMKCYVDRWECYSLNEITIYWNSPAIFCAAFLDSVK